MKKTALLSGFAAVCFFFSCEERPIEIPDLTVGKRRVLVEEATGVRCSQCPDGARTLTSLQGTFKNEGRELIVVSIHAAGPFSVPYTGNPANKFDFRSPDAQAVVDYIGGLEGFPSSSINRGKVPNEISLFINPHTRWEGLIAEDFATDYGLDMFISNEFNPASRQLSIKVDVLPDQTLNEDLRMTVYITEDSIIDLQNDNNVYKPNYVHRHVLREAVTSPEGDPLGEPLTGATILTRTFSTILKPDWAEKHCSVVAFIHRNSTSDKEVLQAAEAHAVD